MMRRIAGRSLLLIDQLAELADLGSGVFGTPQELRRAQRHFLGVVFILDAISAAFLPEVLARSWLVFGCRMRTCSASHCTFTGRPIHPGGKP